MGIHYCKVGGRAIFLDIHRNRYFALPASTNEAFVKMTVERKTGVISAEMLRQIAQGIIPDGPIALASPIIAAPKDDRMGSQAEACTVARQVLSTWLTMLLAKAILRISPLHIILGWLSKTSGQGAQELDYDVVDRIGAAFRKANLFIRSDGNCLANTLAFVWLCQQAGQRPSFVIGVRINPFSAHCWSQDGVIVLNDDCERVLPYEPILVI